MAVYMCGRGFELGMTKNESGKWPEQDSNLGLPDCTSDALTTQPGCLLVITILLFIIIIIIIIIIVKTLYLGILIYLNFYFFKL